MLTSVAALLIAVQLVQSEPPADSDLAEILAQRAIAAFRAGEHQQAGELFLRAYQLSGRATPLRNAAKAFETAGLLDQALVHWSVYAALDGLSTADRTEARKHVLEIRKKLGKLPPDRPPDPPSRSLIVSRSVERTAGYAILGTGIAALGTGALLWGLASADLGDLDEQLGTTNAQGLVVGIDRTDAEHELASINAKRTAGIVLTAVGAAATVFGTVWVLAHPDRASALAPPNLTIGPTRGGALILWSTGL